MTSSDTPNDGKRPSSARHDSILQEFEQRIGARARVVLHDLESSPGPTRTDGGGEAGAGAKAAGRYEVLDLLGQGGVGAVHRGRDADLGREVAMKFLHDQYRDRPDVLHRFVEEAQIGGQLQHPGIVPVYELGMVDGRPFFAMKMIQGVTMASRLDARESPESERGSLLAIFEQICQTVAYAHARGVVHRDLKPANVMIGSFGEVQVVDWGMGKVLPRDDDAPRNEPAAKDGAVPQAGAVETVRTQGHGSQSLVGSVMGTPAYMPREQALGDVEAMDRRSDVFALGAILCEILTGLPPYIGTPQEMLMMAARGELEAAHGRLRSCRADPELVSLALACLQAEPGARPANARAVADAVHAYLAGSEARARDATLRAMTLKRTQKYGIALTGVIAVGLGVSLWFWRDADEQRDAAQKAAVAADEARTLEQAAREQAETNLANFNRLSQFVRLEAAKSSAADLFPAWPEQIAAMREWQEKQARPLREALPGLKDTLQQLEHRALPEQAAGVAKAPQLAAQRAERAAELARMTAKLACWRKAAAVRAGEAKVEEVDLTGGQLPDSTLELNKLAWSLVRPDREDYGREAEGLMIARRALARTEDGDLLRSTVLDTLAWACVAVGLDDEAIAHSEAALAGAPEAERGAYQGMLNRVREQVRNFQIAGFAGVVDDLARNTEELRREVERRATWAFDDDGDTFLHGTLERLIADVQAFLGDEVVDVDRRLSWAERVRELTITRHAARWQEAREAIAKADGTTASTLYAAVPIDLQPQMGLIPLGMNPTTKLWEFYHLRSAWDPAEHADPADVEIPQYRGKAQFDMNGRGLVFVLLPGGTFDMGAQDEDPALPNYDPKADQDEMPVTEVTLDPFFLSKYEMTQGQWARLTNGEWPSWYIVGNGYTGIPVVIMDSHPVEQVDWAMCAELMRRHAMVLPTEAQWEYGCRAGTQWPWSTGPELASLEGYCNVLDQTGSKVEPVWVGGEAWDDGYKGPSPVGTYLPNPFGFYDMHGNMWEWCQDWFGRYTEPARAGDGLREPEFYEIIRGSRGGGHQSTGAEARSAFRAYRAPNTQVQNQSLRPARRLMR